MKQVRKTSEERSPLYAIDRNRIRGGLRQLRKRAGLSAKDVMEATSVNSMQAVYRWERDSYQEEYQALPSLEDLCCLSRLYGVSIHDILMGGAA